MKTRIAQFQKSLRLDGAVVDNTTDFLYLTGLNVSRGTLVVTRKEAAVFVDGRYFEKAKKEAPCPVHLLEGDAPIRFLKEQGVERLEFDSALTSYDAYLKLKKEAGTVESVPFSRLLKGLRIRKSEEEIGRLKRAAELTYRGYSHVAGLLKEGVSEEELSLEFEFFVRKHGASGLSFEPIVAFGENSAYPHHRAGKTRLKRNQVVLIDVGAIVDSYRGDLTRVHFFGSVDPELEKMLHWTKRAQQAAIQMIRPGVKVGELDRAAREVFRKEGVEELFAHGLGHGVGLETHEFPSLKAGAGDFDLELQPGMVFTVEPGLYKPGLGGVRWEDVVCVTERGVELLGGGTC